MFDRRAERAADQFAARLLIDEGAVREAELLHASRMEAVAHEPGGTRHLLKVWRRSHVWRELER